MHREVACESKPSAIQQEQPLALLPLSIQSTCSWLLSSPFSLPDGAPRVFPSSSLNQVNYGEWNCDPRRKLVGVRQDFKPSSVKLLKQLHEQIEAQRDAKTRDESEGSGEKSDFGDDSFPHYS